MANTSGGEPQTLGSTFYLYYVDPFGDWSQSNLERVRVTLGSTQTTHWRDGRGLS